MECKEKVEDTPLLYDLTTLQNEANAKHGFTAEKTLEIAQKLYEKKLITYPRTGSRYIPEDVFDEIPKLLAFTLLYMCSAGDFSFHFSTEENFTVCSPVPSVDRCTCQKASGVKRLFSQ